MNLMHKVRLFPLPVRQFHVGVQTNQAKSSFEFIESSYTYLYASSSSSSKNKARARLDVGKRKLEIDSFIAREPSSNSGSRIARVPLDFLAHEQLEISSISSSLGARVRTRKQLENFWKFKQENSNFVRIFLTKFSMIITIFHIFLILRPTNYALIQS